MSDPERHPAALPLARLCREIRRAAALSRTRTNGSFDAMLSELESNAARLDGFADTLSAIAEEFGLTLEDEGSFHSELEEAREAQEEEGGPPRGVAAELQA
jgi:hypothetical protein